MFEFVAPIFDQLTNSVVILIDSGEVFCSSIYPSVFLACVEQRNSAHSKHFGNHHLRSLSINCLFILVIGVQEPLLSIIFIILGYIKANQPFKLSESDISRYTQTTRCATRVECVVQ